MVLSYVRDQDLRAGGIVKGALSGKDAELRVEVAGGSSVRGKRGWRRKP